MMKLPIPLKQLVFNLPNILNTAIKTSYVLELKKNSLIESIDSIVWAFARNSNQN